MAKGFKHGAGGGASLNFKVVGNPQPTSPKENTIWLNTDVPIGGWYFNATQPEGLSEGDVWFSIGTSSPVAFNALKKNGVMVYPISAKQYISGAWVNVTTKSYQGGKWVDWITYLFDNGNQFNATTGGFVTRSMSYNSTNSTKATPSVSNANGMMTITIGTNNAGGAVTTANKIDLSSKSILYFDGYLKGHGDSHPDYFSICIWSALGTYRTDNLVAYYNSDGKDSIKTIDVSKLSGSYYIGFYCYDNEGSAKMRRMWLE